MWSMLFQTGIPEVLRHPVCVQGRLLGLAVSAIIVYFVTESERQTMAEIADVMKLKRERVRQIRDKAVRKLRKAYRQKLMELRNSAR